MQACFGCSFIFNHKNSGEATSIFTQIASTQSEAIKYNKDGSIGKKKEDLR
jgi:hypothetical protein